MEIYKGLGAAGVVVLALAVSFCTPSPLPCLRNSDCATDEFCSNGACLIKAQQGDATVVHKDDATVSTGAGGAAMADARDEGDTVGEADVQQADANREADAASEADVASEADAYHDVYSEADVHTEADVDSAVDVRNEAQAAAPDGSDEGDVSQSDGSSAGDVVSEAEAGAD